MARSEVNFTYDNDTAFIAPGSAAVTATAVLDAAALAGGAFATSTGIALDKMVNVRPSSQANKLGAQGYKVAIVVSEAKVSVADEAYTFNAYVGATGDGNGGTLVGTIVLPAGTATAGQYVLALDAHTIENMDADREEISLELVAAGTSPSITFSAWLNLG